MIYRNSSIPDNYNKIIEIQDNYVVWTKESILNSNTYYDVYVQYFKPNFYVIHLDNYVISKGTNYVLNANYFNSGVYSYIDNYDLTYSCKSSELISGDDYSSHIKYIADYNELNVSVFCLFILILWVFNNISKLWHKGGCFF